MAPTSSNDSLTAALRRLLLDIAGDSIRHGLETGFPLPVAVSAYPTALQTLRATFVTLERGGNLRGCVGSLEAVRPLVVDVAQNAYAAAFRDPRFPPLRPEEAEDLKIHISILSPPQLMHFESEADLLAQLRPGIDGLILEEGQRRSTFLPSVWESLPEPESFLRRLKRKAGLPEDYWSDALRISRYTAEIID